MLFFIHDIHLDDICHNTFQQNGILSMTFNRMTAIITPFSRMGLSKMALYKMTFCRFTLSRTVFMALTISKKLDKLCQIILKSVILIKVIAPNFYKFSPEQLHLFGFNGRARFILKM
jgi:hypothetical protein